MIAQATPAPPETVRAVLADVLAREGIPVGEQEPGWLARSLRWLAERLGLDLSSADVSLVFAIIAATFALLCVFWLARVKRRRVRGLDARTPQAADGSPARARALALRQAALEAEARGELALALRLNLFALIVGLSEHGDLEYREAWTNRELVARGRPRPEVRDRLSDLLDDIDPKTFGRARTTPEDLRRVESLSDEFLEGVFA